MRIHTRIVYVQDSGGRLIFYAVREKLLFFPLRIIVNQKIVSREHSDSDGDLGHAKRVVFFYSTICTCV